jgi:hypothetical protein
MAKFAVGLISKAVIHIDADKYERYGADGTELCFLKEFIPVKANENVAVKCVAEFNWNNVTHIIDETDCYEGASI